MKNLGIVWVALLMLAASRLMGDTRPQAAETVRAEMIDIYSGMPLRQALEALTGKYYFAITFEDAWSAGDLVDMTYVRKSPGPPIVVPGPRRLRFSYATVNGVPQEPTTVLLRRLVSEYAAEGGPVFEVRERTTPNGPEWNVIAIMAKDVSGAMVRQPDILGAPFHAPPGKQSGIDFIKEMCRQITAETGYQVVLDTLIPLDKWIDNFGAEGGSAREALADLLGRLHSPVVWELNYDPERAGYVLNLISVPLPPPQRPLPPPPPGPPHYGPVPPTVWLRRALTPNGTLVIQTALARAGYLQTAPTGQWDVSARDAIWRFQAANGLQPTGALNPETILKLEQFLPVLRPHPKPPSAMYPELVYWLQSTKEGQQEIQAALAKAGFYSGAVNGLWNAESREALKAFQQANGLQPSGSFDGKTAEELAPFLSSPKPPNTSLP